MTRNSVLGAIIGYAVAAWYRHKTVDLVSAIGFATGTLIVQAFIWWFKKRKAVQSEQTTI